MYCKCRNYALNNNLIIIPESLQVTPLHASLVHVRREFSRGHERKAAAESTDRRQSHSGVAEGEAHGARINVTGQQGEADSAARTGDHWEWGLQK